MSISSIQRRMLLRSAAVLGPMVISGCTWIETLLAPAAKPWPRWTRHDDANTKKIDHGAWTDFLARHVVAGKDGINRVRYREIAAGNGNGLSGYLDELTSHPISKFARAEQQAYWINLYNARTIQLIAEHYPLASIMNINISPGWLSFGPWDKKLVSVEGVALSLNDIEHRILRPGWPEPRLHYALNCGALGCPNLNAIAYTRANMETLLVQGAHAYVNHSRGVTVTGGNVTASKIYAWFKEDFGNRDRAVIEHFGKHAEPDLGQSLRRASAISSYTYNWALNGATEAGA